MNEITVQKIPQILMTKLTANGCTRPKHCFSNCAQAVTNFGLADTYVLCFAEIPYSGKLGHALIKVGNHYYDPTLEPQGVAGARYWLHTEFSKQELREFVINYFKDAQPTEDSCIEVYPPALRKDGKVVCEEIAA